MPTGKRMNAPAPLINTPKLDSFIMSESSRKNAETKQNPTLAFFLEKIVSIVEGFPITKMRSQTMATISSMLTLAIKRQDKSPIPIGKSQEIILKSIQDYDCKTWVPGDR